jgi:hypothetical protein
MSKEPRKNKGEFAGDGQDPKRSNPQRSKQAQAAGKVAAEQGVGQGKPVVAKPVKAKQPKMSRRAKAAQADESTDTASGAGKKKRKFQLPTSLSPNNRFLWLKAMPSWLVSMVVHMAVLMTLALLTIAPPVLHIKRELVIGPPSEEVEEFEEFVEEDLADPVDMEVMETPDEMTMEVETEVVQDVELSPFDDLQAAPTAVELSPLGLESAPKAELAQAMGAFSGQALSGRGAAARKRMVEEAGGSAGSEAAVAAALRWFANHQLPDGGWHVNHQPGQCEGRCPNPGDRADCRMGATGLALLPMLGAGQTHMEGDYMEVVKGGLAYLIRSMKIKDQRGSLVDGGNYYSHGLAAIALCEAYAMTQDPELAVPAQLTINEIVYAQDPVGGGWRYAPRSPGDTSVAGWCLMALKSGHMAGLSVPPITVQKAIHFFESVTAEDGFKHRYQLIPDSFEPPPPGEEPKFNYSRSTSAAGILSRMYLGWKKEEPNLEAAVKWLGKEGPWIDGKSTNLYFNYYATQVMRHYGDKPWEKWNGKMRDYLVNSQVKIGHADGSWYFGGNHDEAGGRLFTTSLATMILEVYYRHLPLYKKDAAEEDFPLE